ncbi:MAG: GNAT family N-acetyltransferase [Candidatus Hydrogenedentes bacterium]|nr:GNAT family N-acetyltransferase [Candidatus Hydrogenedentota bacterium]
MEALASSHDRTHFCCGQLQLDSYITDYAGQHARKNVGRTFVAVRPGQKVVLGYYTLASSSVAFEHLPEQLKRKLPRYPLPVALLGKLAVDQKVQGQGLGEFLLLDALHRCSAIAEQMALFAVEVHALDQAARNFYVKYGFQPFQEQPLHLFLPLDTIKQLF